MKTKLFYLVAILTISMISFSSCSKDKDEVGKPDEPVVEPIISQADLKGTWIFQSVVIDNITYKTTAELKSMELLENNKFNLSFDFDIAGDGVYNLITYMFENNNKSTDYFTHSIATNIIHNDSGVEFLIQNYTSITKLITIKVVHAGNYGGIPLLNSIYTFKKQ